MTRRFTGAHMAIVMLAFFGIVIAVNLVMARAALSTFGGTVVDNSYVASQRYNRWLAEARAERKLGWQGSVSRLEDGHIDLSVSASGSPLAGLSARGVAIHPLGRTPDTALRFVGTGDGHYRSDRPLPAGRWQLRLDLRRGEDRMRLIEQLG